MVFSRTNIVKDIEYFWKYLDRIILLYCKKKKKQSSPNLSKRPNFETVQKLVVSFSVFITACSTRNVRIHNCKQLAYQSPNLFRDLNKFAADPLHNPITTTTPPFHRRSNKTLHKINLPFTLPIISPYFPDFFPYLSPGRGLSRSFTSARPCHGADGLVGRVPVLEYLSGRHARSTISISLTTFTTQASLWRGNNLQQ